MGMLRFLYVNVPRVVCDDDDDNGDGDGDGDDGHTPQGWPRPLGQTLLSLPSLGARSSRLR